MTALAVAARSPEWYAARRDGITSTDMPALLGIDPYGKSEGDVAQSKAGQEEPEAPDPKRDRMLRLGRLLEPVIRAEDEAEHGIRLRRVNRILVHPELPWAMTSLDFDRVGERTIVEAKASRSGRWADGLPDDIEAQVRWQMGCARYPRAHVALLRSGSELVCFDLEHDDATFADMVTIAEDFRVRLAAGGPFAETAESVKRRWPRDSGAEMEADADVADAVRALVAYREQRRGIEASESALEAAIKTRMADAAVLIGSDFRVTWKRTKDRTETDWKAVAADLLAPMPETERAAFVGSHTAAREGFRPFRVSWGAKGDTE